VDHRLHPDRRWRTGIARRDRLLKITGEEDIFSHTDLWDFNANVQGSQTAVASVRPILDERNPDLGKRVDERFAAVEQLLDKYRDGDGFVLYDKVTEPERKALSDAIDALSKEVSQVQGVIAPMSRRDADRAAVTERPASGVPGAGCSVPRASVPPSRRGGCRGVGRRASAAGTRHDHLQAPCHSAANVRPGSSPRRRTGCARHLRCHHRQQDRSDRHADGLDAHGRADDPRRGGGQGRRCRPESLCATVGYRRSARAGASQLTLTIGFGPSLFNKDGKDRFGIAGKRPQPLRDLPKFPNETMDPGRTGGDICVQACANDPQVAVHAIRNLARVGFGTASVRYSQLGFGRTSSTTRDQATPRNLFGFKDGTNNIKSDETQVLDDNIWVADGDGPGWLAGGTYMVTRRIRMRIESWDRTTLLEQERVIGREKGTGAPLGQSDEFDKLNFEAEERRGRAAIDKFSHVRLASPELNNGIEILRRGYNFTDGTDGFGHLDAGLFFIAFVRNPTTPSSPCRPNCRGVTCSTSTSPTTARDIRGAPGIREGDTQAYWGSTLFE
jgi:deferrochelatase/peroxidase EfeB